LDCCSTEKIDMSGFLQDLVYSARGLRKSPGFSLTAIAAIVIGLGATTAIFSLLDAAILRPLPFRDARTLVAIFERPPLYLRNSVSPATYLDWRDENHSFEAMGAMAFASRTLTGYGMPVRLSGQQVTSSYFELLGVQPSVGRLFTVAEESAPLALISERLWMQRFAGDRAALGRVITLDGQPFTICGVMPPQARVQGDPDVWTSLALDREHARRGSHTLWVIARLKSSIELAQASVEMEVIAKRIAATAPDTNGGWGVTIDPLQSYLVGGDLRMTSLALFGAVWFLLLLSCVNVANLLMVRAAGRTREIAVRAALGASRGRIISQLLTESLLVALLGGAAGLWAANLLLEAAIHLLPKGTIPAAIVLRLDTRVTCFTLAVSIVTGILFGLAPAWASAAAGLAGTLRSSGRAITSPGGIRNILASTEIALALVLLSGAGLLTRTLLSLEKVDRGYEPGNVLTMRLSLPKASYPTRAREVQFYQAAEREVASLAGVRSAGFSVDLPLGGGVSGSRSKFRAKPWRKRRVRSPISSWWVPGILTLLGSGSRAVARLTIEIPRFPPKSASLMKSSPAVIWEIAIPWAPLSTLSARRGR
jgi:putative ABC transport system permease protein